MTIHKAWRPSLAAVALAVTLPALGDAASPAYIAQPTDLARLDNGLSLQGADVATLDGITSGFRLTAGYTPPGLPRLDLGAEVSYEESEDVPISGGDRHMIVDTTSLGGSLLAGVRLGWFGLYAKSGLASWQGETVAGPEETAPGAGTSRVKGFGARLHLAHMISRLDYQRFQDRELAHLNRLTASVHFPF
ncbi:hypothetical protein [Halomonas maura]|uniref:hypothetical protein n=1 Tax=Halomonas maura TaxID=117606 RepID=UPI0025B394D9|nr:hypothetical protein [Halomonas maura]MDN3556744.1 hypothetical protein [Halomonas maura]